MLILTCLFTWMWQPICRSRDLISRERCAHFLYFVSWTVHFDYLHYSHHFIREINNVLLQFFWHLTSHFKIWISYSNWTSWIIFHVWLLKQHGLNSKEKIALNWRECRLNMNMLTVTKCLLQLLIPYISHLKGYHVCQVFYLRRHRVEDRELLCCLQHMSKMVSKVALAVV